MRPTFNNGFHVINVVIVADERLAAIEAASILPSD